MSNFASWRLGKTSVEDIHRLNKLPLGIQKDLPRFDVKCTQVPQDFVRGTYVFIWLGSDNNKGIATEWKQGYKAIGRLVHINRAEKFADESTFVIEILYVFSEVFNRLDILRDAPIPYYWCSSFPIIGIDDHSNQTIRMFGSGDERSDIKAFFAILSELVPNFRDDAVKVDASWKNLLNFENKDPRGNRISHSNETEVIAEDATLNQFVRKCIKHFYELDTFNAFWPATIEVTGWNDATFRTIKDKEHGIIFTGLFRADKGDEGQYFPEVYPRDGHNWYLPSGWNKYEFVPNTNNRYGLPIQGLQRLVACYYPSYEIVISSDGYKLLHTKPQSSSFQSPLLPEFWNHVGQAVLEIDEDFSRLSRYYHKGHIRVRTNYGGACNFSLGFYDDNSGRVNKDVMFSYNEKTDSEGEHHFYLNIDTDAAAFEKFIPIFNETYQGLFEITFDGSIYSFRDLRESTEEPYKSKKRRQVIYFGAPGTGKSYTVNKIVKEEAPKRNLRTTFHPDTDYSSFVGCYKPTMRDGKIEYSFTPQAFVNAYIGAWSDLSKPFYLIIEEINRGNCAQIFGDIFQLLDRNSDGESNYSIRPDTDLQTYIASKLGLFSKLPDEIRSGSEMRLPRNLFIFATMNTSDQSLFPIDSAFKRRWDMRYTAIKPAEKDHVLVVGGHRYNWTSFIRKVNAKIFDLTKSEDKQLGYWFISPDDNGEIDWELFVSKAIFYIWNDVVKDYATMEKEDSPFGKKFAFTTFFNEDGEPLIEQTLAFLTALGVEKMPDVVEPENGSYTTNDGETFTASEPESDYNSDTDSDSNTSKDNTKYQINGTGKISKKNLAAELVRRYVDSHPEESAFDVVKAWRSLGNIVSHFVELQQEFDARTDTNPRVQQIECNGENLCIHQWMGRQGENARTHLCG